MSDETKFAYIYKTTIKTTYGLTDAWIKRLGSPDKEVPNPYYRSRRSYLYLRQRVEDFIDDHREEYDKLIAGRAERSRRANEVMSRRIRELVDWAETVQIEIGHLPERLGQLKKATVSRHELFEMMRGRDWSEFILSLRAIVAYVRHNMSNYETLLGQCKSQPGTHLAYCIIRNRIDQLIEQRLRDRYGNSLIDNFSCMKGVAK